MLEWLLLAYLSTPGQEFMAYPVTSTVPAVEAVQPADLPIQSDDSVNNPRFINDPTLAVYAQDLESGKVLFDKRADNPQAIASLTKMMTYLVIREEHDLDEVVTIPIKASRAEGARVGFYAFEKVTIRTLLEAILIPSANDAALALALHNADSEADFVVKMNKKAKAFGLDSAKFYNASGLDVTDLKCADIACNKILDEKVLGNTMNAKDIALLARIALQDDFFRATVRQRVFYGQSVDGQFSHEKESTNKLLVLKSFVASRGVKTGYTELAGQCFVNLSLDDEGREILTVVLGSSSRFSETEKLMNWIWDSFEWR